MNKEKTLIVLGDSPFLGTIQGKLQRVLEMYPSIGINVVIEKYKTKFHIFQDFRIAPIADKHPEIPSITTNAAKKAMKKDNCELVDSFGFSFKKHTSNDIIKDGKLAWCSFTHDYAVSWAIWKGYENVVLIGAADFVDGPHHTLGGAFRYSIPLSKESIQFLSEVCTKRINIYTCNPKSSLKVPRVTLDDLLLG